MFSVLGYPVSNTSETITSLLTLYPLTLYPLTTYPLTLYPLTLYPLTIGYRQHDLTFRQHVRRSLSSFSI